MLEAIQYFFACGALLVTILVLLNTREDRRYEWYFMLSFITLDLLLVSSAVACFVKGVQCVWLS